LKISHEFAIGVLAVIAIAVLTLSYRFLKGGEIFSTQNTFYVLYDRVDQLNASNPILINGLKVGRVKELKLTNLKSGKVLAILQLDSKFEIPKDSKAKIISLDLLGQKGIEIIRSDSQKMAIDGDTLIPDIQRDLTEQLRIEILPVKNKAEELMGSLDDVVVVLKTIIEEGELESSLKSAQSAFKSFAETMDGISNTGFGQINDILSNLNELTTMLARDKDKIDKIIGNFETLSDSLSAANIVQTLDNANKAIVQLETVLKAINEGEGTVAKLLYEDGLYTEIDETLNDLQSLLSDVEENPGRYVHLSLIKFGDRKKKRSQKRKKAEEIN